MLCHHHDLRKQKHKNKTKEKKETKENQMNPWQRRAYGQKERRNRNPENNVTRNVLVNISWMEKS